MKTKHGACVAGPVMPEYIVWCGMKARCHNPNHTNYKNYGARGVIVCGRWRESFASFLADVGQRPSAKHSLDRIDRLGDYEPGNVRWATRAQQARNSRQTRLLTAFGLTMCVEDWSIRTGIPRRTITSRIDRHGWSHERALTRAT